jgi:hypothetical protein
MRLSLNLHETRWLLVENIIIHLKSRSFRLRPANTTSSHGRNSNDSSLKCRWQKRARVSSSCFLHDCCGLLLFFIFLISLLYFIILITKLVKGGWKLDRPWFVLNRWMLPIRPHHWHHERQTPFILLVYTWFALTGTLLMTTASVTLTCAPQPSDQFSSAHAHTKRM